MRVLKCILIASLFFISMAPLQAIDRSQLQIAEDLSIADSLRIAAKHYGKNSPTVTLTLKNGSQFQGHVSSFQPSQSTCTLVNSAGDPTLVKIEELAALTFIDAGSARVELQGNKIYRHSDEPVISQLNFKRYLKTLKERPDVVIVSQFSEREIQDDDCRFYSEKVLQAIERALVDVMSDQEGQGAMQAKGNSIYVDQQKTAQIAVTAEDEKLTLRFDCSGPLPSDYQKRIASTLKLLL